MSIRRRRCTRLAMPVACFLSVLTLSLLAAPVAAWAQATPASRLPITPEARNTAQRVAQNGVALADLAPNAPDSRTVQPGDTLWGVSSLFLKSPWRWPELWGMNLSQIRNPHLIYPGQVLVLEKRDGRAYLRVGQASGEAGGTVKMSPKVRSQTLDNGAIASIPLNLIGPFLNEAVVFNSNELETAPRVVATQEGRVLVSRGELAYVRGDTSNARDYRLFRELTPLLDPETREVLGYEGRYVGTAELVRKGETITSGEENKTWLASLVNAGPQVTVVPDTVRITNTRLEAGVGDRLSPVPQQELVAYVPHPPSAAVNARVIAVYGDGLRAGQNQVVSINRGTKDGMERGHVLALWRAGQAALDTTTPGERTTLRLPDERHGLVFVFRTFERVSYGLILNVQDPVGAGDRLTQP
jgi:LysM domain